MIVAKAAAIFCLLITPTLGAEWFCIPDKSTGFKWQNNDWQSVDFNTPHKYLISEVPGYPWADMTVGVEVTQVGKEYPDHRCPALEYDQIACGGLGIGFVFNKATLRYMEFYGFGFVDGLDEPGNTPMIEIGKCSPLR